MYMNSKQTHAQEALETFMKEEEITIPESVQSQMIHSNTTRKDLIEYTKHLGTIVFYEKHIPSVMSRMYAHYETCINEKVWCCGARAQEMVESLHRSYEQLEEARYQIDLLLGQIMMEIEHLTQD